MASAAERLRALMCGAAARRPVLAPGVWDGLSARLARHAAAALYGSDGDGRAVAARMAPASWRDEVVGTAAMMQAEARWAKGHA